MTPRKSTTERGQVNPGFNKVKFSNRYFPTKNAFLNKFDPRIPKKSFLFPCDVWKYSKSQFEKWHQRIRFWGYVCQKWVYQPEIWHALCTGMVLQHIVRFFIGFFYNFGALEKFIWKSQFFIFERVQKRFWENRDSSLKELLILRLLVLFYLHFTLNLYFWKFSNIYPFSTKNDMTVGHLYQYISKSYW